MKKLVTIILLLSSMSAHAGWFDGFYFEPLALCVGGGAAGYLSTSKEKESDRGQNAAIGCAVGALIGYGINSYYDNKFGQQYTKDLRDKDRMIQEMQWSTVDKMERGVDGELDGVIVVEQIQPAQKLSNGDILMPTKVKKLIIPGEGARIGK